MKQTRRNWLAKIGLAIAGIGLSSFKLNGMSSQNSLSQNGLFPELNNIKNKMKLGAFSVSLNVKDLQASKEFYENLGFESFGGGSNQNYLIMKNGDTLIGLFYGMFEKTMLTFNPGWDQNAKLVTPFDDVRTIQKSLKEKGIKISPEADEKTTGPAYIMLSDPDGNQILIDQHV